MLSLRAVADERSEERLVVELDGRGFNGVPFSGCTLVYRGTAGVTFARCTFERCRLVYKDAVVLSSANLRALVDVLGDEGFSALFSPSSPSAGAVVAAAVASPALAVRGTG